MEPIPIVHYVLQWNPRTKSGRISIALANRQQHDVPVSTAEEFNAVATILKESPVFLSDNGTITTGWEPVEA